MTYKNMFEANPNLHPEDCFRIPLVPPGYGHGRMWGGAISFLLSYFPDAPKEFVWSKKSDNLEKLKRSIFFWDNYLRKIQMSLNNSNNLDQPIIAIIGIPMDSGVGYRSGARFGPRAIRSASAQFGSCSEIGLDLTSNKRDLKFLDIGDVEIHPYIYDGKVFKDKVLNDIDKSYLDNGDIPPLGKGNLERINNTMKWVLGLKIDIPKDKIVIPPDLNKSNKNILPIAIGGDHSITPECVRALKELYKNDNFGVIYFDAHPDFLKTRNGFERNHATQAYEVSKIVGLKNIIQIGTRYIETEERIYRDNNNVFKIDARELSSMSIKEVIDKLAEYIQERKWKYVYLSFDIDVLDAGIVPGTGVPEPGGLTPRYVIDIIQNLIKYVLKHYNIKLAGMDIVEVAPDWDISNIAALSAVKLIFETIGSYY